MATSLASTLVWNGFGAGVLGVLEDVPSDLTVAVVVILVFILLLGLFIEGIPILIIFTPVLLPVVQGRGVDPVDFRVVLVVAVVIGSVTPPVGILNYICCSIAGLTISQAFRGSSRSAACWSPVTGR